MNKNKIIAFLILNLYATGAIAYDVETHKKISESAAFRSVLNDFSSKSSATRFIAWR